MDRDSKPVARRTLLTATATAAAATAGCVGSANSDTDNETNTTNETGTNTSNETSNESSNEDADADAEENNQPLVRIAHLAPDVPAIDVYIDGERYDDIAVLNQTDHVYQEAGEHSVAVHHAGDTPESSQPLLETTVTLESETRYTLVLVGEQCPTSGRPLELTVHEDDLSLTSSGQARIRAIHASPDAPTLDIRASSEDKDAGSGEAFAEGLEFGTSQTVEIEAGEQIIAAHEAGADDPIGRFPIEPKEGHVYTLFAVRYIDPTSAPSNVPEEFTFALGLSAGVKAREV
jgi:hypothetical protein